MTGKYVHTLSFCEGALSVESENGIRKRAYFVFDENEIEWQPHDEKSGNYLVGRIDLDELRELRNFLTRVLEETTG